jgi:hypothetical protein
MAKIIQKNTTEPITPSTGTTAIYIDSTTKKIATKDDAGVVTNYDEGGGGGGGGVTDHGALTGLADDDHLQYFNQSRGDERYNTKAEVDAKVAAEVMHPLDNVAWIDHFMSRNVANNLNWTSLVGGTSQVLSNQNKATYTFLSATDHFGTLNLNLVGTSGRCVYYLGLAADPCVKFGGRQWTQEWRVYINQLATEANDYVFNIGYHSATAADDPTNGIYLQYKRSLSPNWQIVSKLGASEERIVTNIPVATGWQKLGIIVNQAATSIDFYIDNETRTMASPQISTDGIVEGYAPMLAIRKIGDTNQALFAADYFYMQARVV